MYKKHSVSQKHVLLEREGLVKFVNFALAVREGVKTNPYPIKQGQVQIG